MNYSKIRYGPVLIYIIISLFTIKISFLANAAEDGTIRWNNNKCGHPDITIGHDGIIYSGSTSEGIDAGLCAISSDGAFKWIWQDGNSGYVNAPSIATDGTLYIPTSNNLIAMKPDKTVNWIYPINIGQNCSPAIGTDGTIYIGSTQGHFDAINLDGTKKWSFTNERVFSSTPAIGIDGTIYAGSWAEWGWHLHAINPNGTEKWIFIFTEWSNSWLDLPSPVIAVDGTIYISLWQNLYAINPDGTQKWEQSLGSARSYGAAAIGANGTIYIGGYNYSADEGELYALNPDGTIEWTYPINGAIGSPVIREDSCIIFGSDEGVIYSLTPGGALKWELLVGGHKWSPGHPSIGFDGTIYIGNGWHGGPQPDPLGIVAINSSAGGSVDGLAKSSWPMYLHDVRHTGRVDAENAPPEAICQDVIVSTESGLCSADASIDDGSYDPDGDDITLEQTPPGPYDLGDTVVTLTVTDAKGASDTCYATVAVYDDEAPVISSVTASPNKLWPPNHKMVPLTVVVDASDNCDYACQITSVESNEPVNGLGDGDTAPDWIITGDLTAKLRAERSGNGNGRTYTITVECTDQYRNSATDTATVTVPHDKRKNNNKKK